ncbi:substrate-binding domain-containing protein [Pseudomonas corrugata]|uniref:substrate-binding domain-containing protein n=1 Tax=Pseudomonas corrugata TaxID=47879 RepID=UPI0006D8B750|nr:substrate-binding domain-containing protein [Pseudomonas corrugata]
MKLNVGSCCLVSLLGASVSMGLVRADGPSLLGKGADVQSMCGDKPMVIAVADGVGGNTDRKVKLAEVKDEIKGCANVTRFLYTNANGDLQKANADLNGLVAQGANIILVFPDFGTAQLPAMRSAVKAGVTVVPYLAKLDGVAGRDFTANVYQDTEEVGRVWADWYGKNLGKGNLVFLGGTPGARSSQLFLEGFKKALAKYPSLKLLSDDFVVTQWDPVSAQKAVSGLIAQYPSIDGVATDYGVTALAAVKAFEQAEQPVPAIATMASSNELNCKYLAAEKTASRFQYLTLDGTSSTGRFAVRRGISEFQRTRDPESLALIPFTFADSHAAIVPKCDPAAPPDADLSSLLPPMSWKKYSDHPVGTFK